MYVYIYIYIYITYKCVSLFFKHMHTAYTFTGICRQITKLMSGNTRFLQQRATWGSYRNTNESTLWLAGGVVGMPIMISNGTIYSRCKLDVNRNIHSVAEKCTTLPSLHEVSRNAQLSKSDFVLDIHFLESLENDQMKGSLAEEPSKQFLNICIYVCK